MDDTTILANDNNIVINKIEIEQNKLGQIVKKVSYDTNNEQNEIDEHIYDNNGQEVKFIKRFPKENKFITLEYKYDSKGRYAEVIQTNFETMVQSKYVKKYNCGELIDMEEEIYKTTLKCKSTGIMPMDIFDNKLLENVYNKAISHTKPQIKTGYTDLDELLEYCDKGSLIMIGGASSMGKTVLSKNILLNQLNKGKKCLYFDLEWTQEQCMQSLLFMYAGVQMQRRHILSDAEDSKLKVAIDKMSDWQLEIIDSSYYEIERISNVIRAKAVDYVFIDNLQEIRTDKIADPIRNILYKLRNCARETGTTIFVTSTLEDTVKNNKYQIPTWKDFKNSEAVIKFCDQILLLYRPSCYYSEEDMPESHENNKLEIYSAKTIKGFVSYDFNFDTYRIKPNSL